MPLFRRGDVVRHMGDVYIVTVDYHQGEDGWSEADNRYMYVRVELLMGNPGYIPSGIAPWHLEKDEFLTAVYKEKPIP